MENFTMAWPKEYIEINDRLISPYTQVWNTVPEIARLLHWSNGKTYYWIDRMVRDYWLIWRWMPRRYGWHETRQYAKPHRAK
jgi:hypothetical protein